MNIYDHHGELVGLGMTGYQAMQELADHQGEPIYPVPLTPDMAFFLEHFDIKRVGTENISGYEHADDENERITEERLARHFEGQHGTLRTTLQATAESLPGVTRTARLASGIGRVLFGKPTDKPRPDSDLYGYGLTPEEYGFPFSWRV